MSKIYNGMVALNTFWNSFDIPAYEVSTVPDSVQMPYITYEGAIDSFGYQIGTTINLYYRGKSWKAITEKLEAIKEKIGEGYYEDYEDGSLLILPANPFAQRVSEEDEEVRRYIINLNYEFII